MLELREQTEFWSSAWAAAVGRPASSCVGAARKSWAWTTPISQRFASRRGPAAPAGRRGCAGGVSAAGARIQPGGAELRVADQYAAGRSGAAEQGAAHQRTGAGLSAVAMSEHRHRRHEWQRHDGGTGRARAGEQPPQEPFCPATGRRPVCSVIEQTKELDYLILQIDSFQLEITEVLRPSVAVLTNLAPDHLDRYGSVEDYVRANARLFRNQQAFDWAIVQSEALARLRELNLPVPAKTITFSADDRNADLYLDRGLLISRIPNWSGPLLDMEHCQLRGPHNAENLMAALAVGHVLRLPLEGMVDPMKDLHCRAASFRVGGGDQRGPVHQRFQGDQRGCVAQSHSCGAPGTGRRTQSLAHCGRQGQGPGFP